MKRFPLIVMLVLLCPIASAWTDLPFPAASENFYQALSGGGSILTKSWQANLLTGSGFETMPVPLNALNAGAQYRMAFTVPPGASRAAINIGYASTVVFSLGAYNEKQDFYGVSNPPQPDTDLQSSSAIASLRLYPIGSAFAENSEACAKTTYFILDGSAAAATRLVSVDLSLQVTNTTAYQAWLNAGKPVCGGGTTGGTTIDNTLTPSTPPAGFFAIAPAGARVKAGSTYTLSAHNGTIDVCYGTGDPAQFKLDVATDRKSVTGSIPQGTSKDYYIYVTCVPRENVPFGINAVRVIVD